MDFFLVRHGQPRWSIGGMTQRDPELTELGHEQAQRVAKHLINAYDVTHVVHSTALRAMETAAPLLELTGVEPAVIHGIREIDMPQWDAIEEAQVIEIFRTARRRPPAAWWAGLEGGESFVDFRDRVVGALDAILEEHGITWHTQEHPHLWDSRGDDGRVAIIAHGGTNAVAITHLLGMEPTPWEWERFPLGHTSITHLKAIRLAGAHAFTLQTYNELTHLPEQLRTL